MRKMELYVHIPFCVQKCAYCDFLSMTAESTVKSAYIRKLKEEIRIRSSAFTDREIISVFIGGGTPSSLHGHLIAEVMDVIHSSFTVSPTAEITIECNPGTLTADKLAFYKKAGINRLSIGLQSAQDKELQLLGRIHTYEDFLASYDCARKNGFNNINVDLMSALPGQTLKSWEQTLKRVTMLRPEHISAYSLIIEEGTPFYKLYGYDDETRKKGEKPLFLPSEEEERQMYQFTKAFLEQKGYQRYEISNYARPGKECIHNVGYWTRVDYLGVGLGAASLVDNWRFSNVRNMTEYLKSDFTNVENIEYQELSKTEQMEEFMFLGLRMQQGINRGVFLETFGTPVESVFGEALERMKQQGLIQENGGQICLTDLGFDVSNYVFSELLL